MNNQLLVDRIEYVVNLGKVYQDANILKAKDIELEEFIVKLNELETKIETIYNNYSNLIDVCDLNEIVIEEVQEHAKLIYSLMKSNKYDITRVDELKNLIDLQNKAMVKLWKKKIEKDTQVIDSVLTILGSIVIDRVEITKMTHEKNDFLSSPPGSQKAREAINRYTSLYNALLDDLKFDDNILEFLKKLASPRKVTLDDMSDDVYRWLNRNGFSKKIRISL